MSKKPKMDVVQGGGGGVARGLQDVPAEYLHPGPDHVMVERHVSSTSEGGIIIPEAAEIAVVVATKVGANVKHVQAGDIVIMQSNSRLERVLEIEGKAALIPGPQVIGVIRGYAWRDQAQRPAIVGVE